MRWQNIIRRAAFFIPNLTEDLFLQVQSRWILSAGVGVESGSAGDIIGGSGEGTAGGDNGELSASGASALDGDNGVTHNAVEDRDSTPKCRARCSSLRFCHRRQPEVRNQR